MSGLLVTPRWKGVRRRSSSFLSVSGDRGDNQEPPPEPRTEGDLHMQSVIDCGKEVLSSQFNPSGTLLAVGLITGTIKVYTASDGICVHTLKDDQTVTEHLPVTSLRFRSHRLDSHGDSLLATYAGGQVRIWHLSTQTCVHSIHEDRQTLTAAFSPSGSHFLTAGSSDEIFVYDSETATCVNICQPRKSGPVHQASHGAVTLLFDGMPYRYFRPVCPTGVFD
ncbi:uncharacterized protein WCC33_013283 [Rhinophrynus dorsalis]